MFSWNSWLFFWNTFSVIQQMLAIWSLVPLPLLNPACTSGSSRFTYWWSLSWRILSITSITHVKWMKLCGSLNILWHCLSLGLEWKLTFFNPMATAEFSVFWHSECSTLTASSFSIWNSSAGIPSPPLASFVVMLTKTLLSAHSRMSGSRWVTTPSWLSRSLGHFFVQFLCVFLPPLLSIFFFC